MVSRHELTVTKSIQRSTGPTFHLATRFLPRRIRHQTYVLYGFFRVADEIVDDPDPPSPSEQRVALNHLQEMVLGDRPPANPVLSAFATVYRETAITETEIEYFLDSMRMDIDTREYETIEELDGYLRGSSVAVANMMLAIMNPSEPEVARPHAKALGEAFQLTNFLRDVREDIIEYNRVYLPKAMMRRNGVFRRELAEGEMSPRFAAVMGELLEETETRYRAGVAGIKYLPDDCQFPVLIASVFYAEYHRLIRAQQFDVLTSRPRIPHHRYLSLLVQTAIHWWRSGDPEAVFYRVSAVDPPSEVTARDDVRRLVSLGDIVHRVKRVIPSGYTR